MSTRKTHSLVTVGLGAIFIPFSITVPDILFVASGIWFGLILYPDLDMSDTPYGWTHKHRGISHIPIIGTIDRVLWFLGPFLGAWALSGIEINYHILILVLIGLILADSAHALMDWFDLGDIYRALTNL